MDKNITVTDNLVLRNWKKDDLAELVRQANNKLIAGNLTNAFPFPYSDEDGEKFIQMANSPGSHQIFCIEYKGKASGGIGLHPLQDIFAQNAELGYWLGADYWGQGLMTLCVNAVSKWGLENLHIKRIFGRPFGSNIGSQKVLEKCGFHLEARLKETIVKNGKVEDELIYGLRKEE